VAAELRRRIWDPVATKIEGSDMVLVVPDGQLALVSLASLPDDDGGYLVEGDLLVHLLGTERDAVAYRDAADSTGGLLVLGAPAFDAPVGQLTLATSSSGEAGGGDALAISSYRGARSGCGSFRALRFAGLPGSASEVDAVAARWPDDDVTKLTGVDANEASFKALAPRSRVLHLATHGFFLEADCTADDGSDPDTRGIGGMAPTADAPQSALGEKNPLSLSGLALAGANTRQQASRDLEDGILTAEEVAALDLSHVEWAVLSACDTGVGAVHVAEGVLGLRRAFRAAGARSLILSLWAVDDAATRDWMEDLYRARFAEGRSTAEAVRSAERSRLVARRARGESTHPFYWGGFIATGDWH
jgi:CHAT domain-containing protein